MQNKRHRCRVRWIRFAAAGQKEWFGSSFLYICIKIGYLYYNIA